MKGHHFELIFDVADDNVCGSVEYQFCGVLYQGENTNGGEIQVFGCFYLFARYLYDTQPYYFVQFRYGGYVPEIVQQHNISDLLLFLQIGQGYFLTEILAEVHDGEGRERFVVAVQRVDNVIFQHDILEVGHGAYFLIVLDAINNFLRLGQHIVNDNMAGQQVYYAVVIDAMGRILDPGDLAESEAFFEPQLHPIEEGGACLVEHLLSFLS